MNYENQLAELAEHLKAEIDDLFNLGWPSIVRYGAFNSPSELDQLTESIANDGPLYIGDAVFKDLSELAHHLYHTKNSQTRKNKF